ncbi:Protein UBASH3A -like protein [Toxocara canis]|uniref:Protein UBASH3A-like protein n=1 Tax=Toxocara canis TaxID=6265 RepID=A0A0B2VL97_TOXCA|nr:Protein UBASH3A -like protein [Toxocara canis]
MAAAVESPTRRLLVVRHSERCDYHFKKKGVKWINSAFDEGGRYRRFDAQMPATLAVRSGGPQDFNDDTPITTSGYSFCVRTGELLRDRGIIADYVYSSPAYRCVQTSQGILEGELSLIFVVAHFCGLRLGVKEVRIRIEPGLFQWMHWCKRGLPHFMSANEFSAAGFPVDVSYRAFDDATTFDEQETLLDYYNRSFALVQRILKLHPKGTILLVGHAGSLETLTRQLSGKKPRERAAFREFLHGTSYLAINEVIERNNKWKITGCPIPPLINSGLDRC